MQLLISFVKPHLAMLKDTLSRWVKTLLCKAEVNMNLFKADSVRLASTSAAARLGVHMQTIMRIAGWTIAQTFLSFIISLLLIQLGLVKWY
jgi:hypothetical protein